MPKQKQDIITKELEAARRLMTGIDPHQVATETGYTIEQIESFRERYRDIVNASSRPIVVI